MAESLDEIFSVNLDGGMVYEAIEARCSNGSESYTVASHEFFF